MVSNKLAIAFIGTLCMLGAAGGAYIATRQNAVPTPATAMTSLPAQTGTTTVAPGTGTPVQETEAVVGDTASKPVPTAAARNAVAKAASPKHEVPRPSASLGGVPAAKATVAANGQDPVAPLDRSWPTNAPSSQSAAPASQTPDNGPSGPAGARADDHLAPEPPHVSEPPQRTFEELVVSADSVLGLQTETRISSETARVEDRIEARVTRDVKVGDKVAIPAGSRAIGSVTLVDRGGKFKERARLGIQFNTLVLADGTRLPLKTETVYRDGEAPGNSSAAKVGGGAIGGAILGAILGGGKGAAIGATAGAGGGAAVVQSGDRAAATLPAGTPMTVRVLSPVTVTIEN